MSNIELKSFLSQRNDRMDWNNFDNEQGGGVKLGIYEYKNTVSSYNSPPLTHPLSRQAQ